MQNSVSLSQAKMESSLKQLRMVLLRGKKNTCNTINSEHDNNEKKEQYLLDTITSFDQKNTLLQMSSMPRWIFNPVDVIKLLVVNVHVYPLNANRLSDVELPLPLEGVQIPKLRRV